MEKDLIDGRQGRRDATSTWLAAAAVEFSTINAPFEFKDAVDFFGWVFPGNARFSGATFAGTAGFSSAKFKQMARFPNATFAGTALFNNAKFTGDAQFAEAIFEEATFAGTATFFDASFTGKARFGQANFQGFTTYHKAIFGAAADFPAILAKRSFVLAGATFHALPDFIRRTSQKHPGSTIHTSPREAAGNGSKRLSSGFFVSSEGGTRKARQPATGRSNVSPSRATTPSASCNSLPARSPAPGSQRIGRCRWQPPPGNGCLHGSARSRSSSGARLLGPARSAFGEA